MTYRILTYDEIDRAEWSRLVAESETGTWFQSPEAYEFFASQPELFVPFVVGIEGPTPNPSLKGGEEKPTSSLPSFQGEELCSIEHPEDGHRTSLGVRHTLRALCCGYVTVEKNSIKQFFTRRAIIIGGPALADDATEEEVTALLEAVKKKAGQKVASLRLPPKGKRATAQKPANRESFLSGLSSLLLGRDGVGSSPIYIETRNFNSYERWKSAFEKAGFEYQPHLNFHVDCTNADEMWIRMSETRRKQIRRAQRADVTISNAQSEEEICEWYAILKRMYKTRVKTPLFPVSFFEEAYRQGVATYLMVRYEGHIIGGSMIVVDGGCVYEWFECGRDVEYEKQYPSVMATYAGMAYAAEHGIARCDFMGAGVPGVPYGVRDFKERFGGKMVEHGRFLYIAKPILYRIGAFGVKIMKGL